jgi:hypothetical protein
MRTSTEGAGLGGLVALLVASMVGVLPLRLAVRSLLAQRSGAESGMRYSNTYRNSASTARDGCSFCIQRYAVIVL